MPKFSYLITLISLVFLTNCDAYRDYKNHTMPSITLSEPTPQNWYAPSKKADKVKILTSGWLEEFTDPKIKKIATQVVNHNYDLKNAANNVTSAEAKARRAGALSKPQGYLGSNNSANGDFDQSNSELNNGVSLDISYEIDLWGKLAAVQDISRSNYQAANEDYESLKQSLIAQSIKAYFLAIATYELTNLNQEIVASFQKDLHIVTKFYEQGIGTKQDIFLAESNLSKSQEDLEQSENAHKEAIRSLEILLGQYPKGEFSITKKLPKTPSAIEAGIPSELLEKRPDIKAAERAIAAAFSETKARKAARLPAIALTSSIGARSDDLSSLSDPKNLFWNTASNILIPLFDGGRLKANVKISETKQLSAINNYQKAALNAFNEVETALSNIDSLNKRTRLLSNASRKASLAYKFANSKYLQGEGNLLDLSEYKRNMFFARADLITAQEDLLGQYINLYLALAIPPFKNEV